MKIFIRVNQKKIFLFPFFLIFVLCGFHFTLLSQTAVSSPYSRYGVGEINTKNLGQTFAIGGTNIAIQNDSIPMFFINPNNPASYSTIRLTTAEFGANFNRVKLSSANTTGVINTASFSYIALAFPYKKWWGGSFGLIPYSSVGYKVTDHQEITNVGGVDYLYEGSGGVNQFYIGNAIKPLYGLPKLFLKSKKYAQLNSLRKGDLTIKTTEELNHDRAIINETLKHKKAWQALSLGFNASYLFGNIDHIRRSMFPYGASFFNTRTGTTTHLDGFYFDYGAQYSYTFDSLKGRDLKDNVKLLVGATFAGQTDVKAKIDSLSYNYYYDSGGYERIKDTVVNSENSKGNITFPLSFGFGLGFKKGDRWMVLSDFAIQNWSSYKAFNQSGGLKNSMRISVGAQLVPNSKAGQGQYFKRIHYRLGARYTQTALELKNTQLVEYAASAGLGFPVGRNYLLQNFSMVNIGAEYGNRGTTSNGLIKENFLKITVSFTINDRWFVKPKFD